MKTNLVREYDRIADAGHSWLAVPIGDVYDAGVYPKISKYSPVKFGVMYLEEDCDAPILIEALESKGDTLSIEDIEVDDFRAYLRAI